MTFCPHKDDGSSVNIDLKSHKKYFDLGVEELYSLIDPKNPKLLKKYGNVEGLAKALKVKPKKGLSTKDTKDLETRRSV